MIKVKQGKFEFNGIRKDMVWGRTSFKLANIVTYHFKGKGNVYSLGDAHKWVEHNQRIFGEDVVLRVFLETAGWDNSIDRDSNGVPNNGMFGSEPSDQGYWNVAELTDGKREQSMHTTGRKTLEWFYKESAHTGVAFELVVNATLKHDDIPRGEMDHVLRQVGVQMGIFQLQYPQALIIVSACNEWNAHSQIPIEDVNNWAMRFYRDRYWDTEMVAPTQIPLIVDGGGSDKIKYKVGRDFYHAAMIHPERRPGSRDWWEMPNLAGLRHVANDYPIGFTESMYYVEEADAERAAGWYRNRAGWDTDWNKFEQFYENSRGKIDYNILHDEKGAGTLTDWPRKETRLEAWAKGAFTGIGGGVVLPPPLPDPIEPPLIDPDPPRGADFLWILSLLQLIGLDTEEANKFIRKIEKEISARGEQFDRIEQNIETILSVMAVFLDAITPEEEEEEDKPDPQPEKKETDYIPWGDREEWAARVFHAYTVWRGERDLGYLLRYLDFVNDALGTEIGRNKLSVLMETMQDAHNRQDRLVFRIETEKHRKYANRSQVRKIVANEMIKELNMLTKEYGEIAKLIPHQPGCDSIKCRIQKMRGEE